MVNVLHKAYEKCRKRQIESESERVEGNKSCTPPKNNQTYSSITL